MLTVAYLGNGDGTFTYAGSVAFNPSSFVLGDFNNDGTLDIAGSSNQLALGNGNGTFQAPVNIVADPPNGGFNWVAKGDVNNDGWLDLMLPAATANKTYVLLNNQHGGFTVSTIPGVFDYPYSGPEEVVLADLNLDGNLDAVVDYGINGDVAIYLGNGHGGFELTSQPFLGYLSGPATYPLTVGDVNGDGIPDILMPSYGSLAVALGLGNGWFLTQRYVGTDSGDAQIILSNIHGQAASAGLPDIVSPDRTGGVLVLINTTPE